MPVKAFACPQCTFARRCYVGAMPSPRRLGSLALLGLALLLAACSPSVNPNPAFTPSPAPSSSLSFTQVDSGRAVSLHAGQSFTVALGGNGTTGYQWSAAIADLAVLTQSGEPGFQPANTSPGIVGSGGLYTFRFQALQAGTTTLVLNYARSWEHGVPPLRSVNFTVVVA
jgi:inhibitor of cysteine peptidase